ncbi:MAG: DEAD/DEAH box helicase [Nitrospirota bacterium]
MSDSKQKEILDFLQSYPAGQIYTLAPKEYIVRGFDYYRRGNLQKFEWNEDFSVLTAKIRGTRLYSVVFSLNSGVLKHSCNCFAWSPYSNCKHVICSLITIKNLLQPDVFRIHNQDEEYRTFLLKCLYNKPAALPPNLISLQHTKGNGKAGPEEIPGYSIVIEKTKHIFNIYLRRGGERISEFFGKIPFELRHLVLRSYFTGYGKLRDFTQYLQKYGNKYPIILKTNEGETPFTFDKTSVYSCKTELDAYSDFVRISKICLCNNEVMENAVFAEDFVFDNNAKKFGIFKSKIGWMFWKYLFEQNPPLPPFSKGGRGGFPDEIPDSDLLSFQMPLKSFQKFFITYPASEGDKPEHLILKVEGTEAKPRKPDTAYHLTIVPSGDDYFLIKAECILDSLRAATSYLLFRFFSLLNKGVNPQLRANKRKVLLYKTFFDMLSADTKIKAEDIIKLTLSDSAFYRYKLKHAARTLLKDHLSIFWRDENDLLLHDAQWLSVSVDKKKQLLLYKIPYELFGWTIFQDTPAYNQMIVKSNGLYEKLPLLYEQLKKEGIELFFDNKPVKTSQWDFAFDACRPSGIDWFEIKPEIRCNGELIDDASFLDMLHRKGAVEKDGCIQIMDSNSKKILEVISTIYKTGGISEDRKKEIVKVPRLQILDWIMLRNSGVKVKLSLQDEEIIERLTSFERIEPRPLPEYLKAKLRQYQKDGYSWLSFLYENRFGACLADDMGLGKTIQAISLLGGIKEKKIVYPAGKKALPHLIVLPPSLLFNWENEIKRFYPSMKIMFYTGKERSTSFDGSDAILTTYGLVRRDIDKLKDIQFDVIIFDEAQAIKNIYADTTGAVRQLKANFKLAMTGTPLENHIGEYYSIVDLTTPGLLGDFDRFKPLIKQDASPSLDMIIKRTRPFVLRRTKEKILRELPPKIETDIYLDLTEKQKALYKKTVEQVKSTIDTAYRTKTQAQAKIIALTAILKLRQLCVSPQLISPEIKEPSPKIDFLIESLKELLKGNHSALVFSQFTSFLDILQEDLKKQGIDFLRLDGSTQVKKRKKLIESFQTGNVPSIFLLSLKAGGQGLNLTKASYVFHLDPWWNPAVENQASDRAHRIGQKNKVTITRILMRYTIEEKMMYLKKKKLELYKAVMEDSSISRRGLSITKSDFNFLLS